MNRKRAAILIIALIAIALILFNDLPIQFPWALNIMLLYVKICIVLAVAFAAFIFAGRKKKPVEKDGLNNESPGVGNSN